MGRAERFLSYALLFAAESSHPRQQMAAVLCKGNRVLSWGKNHGVKTHPLQRERIGAHGPYGKHLIHAELDCLIRANVDISGSVIYVARRMKNGQAGLACPCSTCVSLLTHYGIRQVVYTVNSESSRLRYDSLEF